MNIGGSFDAWVDAFPVEVIPEIIRTVVAEWPRCARPASNPIENRFTNRLVGHLNRVTRNQKLPFGFTYREKIANPDADTEAAEIDITVRAGSVHIFFCFECKTLNVPSQKELKVRSKADEYVGPRGMGCFISGKYDGGLPQAGMIGYVMDGDVDGARKKVDAKIQGAAQQLALLAPKALHAAPIVTGSGVYQTVHRVRRKRFTIYHVLLSVPSVATA